MSILSWRVLKDGNTLPVGLDTCAGKACRLLGVLVVRDLKRWPGCSAAPPPHCWLYPHTYIPRYLSRYVVQELRSKSHRLCTRSTLRSICDLSDFGHASVLRGGRVGFLDGIGSEPVRIL